MQYSPFFSQSEALVSPGMVQNNAGGYGFQVDKWTSLQRFLILGSENGTYYVGECKLTMDNVSNVLQCMKENGLRVVQTVVTVSVAGRAPKNDPALFVLALCTSAQHADEATRKAAFDALPHVARTASHLFYFLESAKAFRGWGKGFRKAVARWYVSKPVDAVAYQVTKYRNRYNWTHRDVLRQSHANSVEHQDLFRWITQGSVTEGSLPQLVYDFIHLQSAQSSADVVRIIQSNPAIMWELVPTNFLTDPLVWEALLPQLPIGATLRNLGRLSSIGVIAPGSKWVSTICEKLTSKEALSRGRIHPLSILSAMTTYKSGHGLKGSLSWDPVAKTVDGLDEAFYASFSALQPTGKRWMLALDISGSMTWSSIAGVGGITPREASAAMSMITARTESEHHFVGFSNSIISLPISPRQRLDDVVKTISNLSVGSTDCAAPMIHALKNKIPVDTFVVYTDSETWCGNISAVQALRNYRQQMGIPAKLIVVGMVANDFSIADPSDAGMLDIVGFDTTAPQVIADFAR